MKTSKKTGETSIRVLETLKILSQKKTSIQDIIKYFEKKDSNNKIYTSEAILKYINTLKVFGFEFTKEKDKYVLLNPPNQFNFNEKDLTSLNLIENFANNFPEEKIKIETNKFLQDLEKRFDYDTKILSKNTNKSNYIKFSPNYSNQIKQIKIYEKYCQEKQKLKITIKNENNLETSMMVEPQEIKYLDTKIYLHVYNSLSAEYQDLDFNSIIKIEQLPSKFNPIKMPYATTFELKDRLAKSYNFHEGEKLLEMKQNGNIVILNQQEDRHLLLKRLMGYGEYCEVLSPLKIREEMLELIKTTLNNYN